jgi:hypothetical protein
MTRWPEVDFEGVGLSARRRSRDVGSYGRLPAVEHHHRCVYCRSEWFCYEDCPLAGPSACDECREKVRRSPDIPRRIVALSDGSQVLDRLAEREAERLRQMFRRRREP